MTDKKPCAVCGETSFIYAKDGSCWNKRCASRGPVSVPAVISVDELEGFFDVNGPHFEEPDQ